MELMDMYLRWLQWSQFTATVVHILHGVRRLKSLWLQRDNLYTITTEQAERNVRNLQRRLVKAATVRDNKL